METTPAKGKKAPAKAVAVKPKSTAEDEDEEDDDEDEDDEEEEEEDEEDEEEEDDEDEEEEEEEGNQVRFWSTLPEILFKGDTSRGVWRAHLVERASLDHGTVSSSHTLGTEVT